MAQNGSLTTKQMLLVAALVAGNTQVVAFKAAGISPRTGARWMKDPAIQDALRMARKEAYNASITGMLSLVDDSIDILRTILHDKETTYGYKLSAVKTVLEHSRITFVDEDIDTRVARIEEEMRLAE